MGSCVEEAESETLRTRYQNYSKNWVSHLIFTDKVPCLNLPSDTDSSLDYFTLKQATTAPVDSIIHKHNILDCRSQLWHGQRCGSVAARLLALRVRISPGPRTFVCREWVCVCVWSNRGLCDGPITRQKESCGSLSVVSVGFCQVEASAWGWSLVQRIPIDVCLL